MVNNPLVGCVHRIVTLKDVHAIYLPYLTGPAISEPSTVPSEVFNLIGRCPRSLKLSEPEAVTSSRLCRL